MKNIGGWLCGCCVLCFCGSANGQWVAPDPNFPAAAGPDFWVRTIALESNGQILIGGLFTNLDGVAQPHFGRLDATGALDSSFKPQLDGEPTHFEPLPDQRILISGTFTNVEGTPRPGLALLHPDGSLDQGFAPPAILAPDNRLSGMSAPDGSVVITGSFTNVAGRAQNHLARLLSSGALDSGFSSPFDATNSVSLQAVQPDGRILVSGLFSNVAGLPATNLVRLNADGSLDPGFQSGLESTEQVTKIWIDAHNRLLVLACRSYFPAWFSRLVRLETNGTLDTSFHPSFEFPGFPWNGTISSLALQPDGKIVVAGNFLRVDGIGRAGVARLEDDGTLDFCFDTPLSANLYATTVAADSAGGILLGGSFSGLQGQLHPNLMRLIPPSGCAPGIIALGPSNIICRADAARVTVSVVRTGGADRDQSVDFSTRDGSAVAGVDYQPVSGTVHLAPGQRSQSVVIPLLSGAAKSGPVGFQLMLTGAGAGATLGELTNANITITPGLAGTAGSVDTNYVVQLDGPVRMILPLANGQVMLVGDFTNVDGHLCPNLARLNRDGTRDPAFSRATPLDGYIASAMLDSAARVLLAGDFQHVDGVWRPGLARFGPDGSLDTSFAPFDTWTNSLGYSAQLRAVCGLADGNLICGGTFPAAIGSVDRMLKLSSAGEVDSPFTNHIPPTVVVGGLTALSDDDFLVVGVGLGNSLVRLHPDGTINFGFIPPADAQLTYYTGNGLGPLADGRLTIAGTASAYYGLPNQPELWRLNPDGSLDPGFSLATQFSSFGPLDYVYTMSVSPDGRVLVAGSFQDGPSATLARFLPDGSPDFSFDSGTGLTARPNGYVSPYTLVALPQGGWLLGGDFGSYDGFAQSYLVRLLPEQTSRPLTFVLSATNLTVWETNGLVTVEVTRTGDASTEASVLVSTTDGTAVAGQDYLPLSTRLDFAPGEWSKAVSVAILDDKVVEPLEQFSIQLTDATGGFTVGASSRLEVQIRDDDAGVEFVAAQFNGVEENGYAMVGVRWSGLLSNGMSVVAQIVPLTGRAEDLGLTSAVATYNGTTTNWFRIPILDDAIPEGVRQFELQLAASAQLLPGPQSNAVLSIFDSDFPTSPARGVAGVVEAVAKSSRGAVYLGGDFTGVHGVPLTRVARLSADGEVDLSFNPAGGPNADVTALAEQPDGELLIAGAFTTVNGVARAGLARLNQDGALDLSFDPGTGIKNTNGLAWVSALVPQDDGTIWIAGAFTEFNNRYGRLLAHLQPDGSADPGFVSPFSSGGVAIRGGVLIPQSAIYSLLQTPDGKLLAGGMMYLGTGLSVIQASVVRLASQGDVDAPFARPNAPPALPTLLTLALSPGGDVLAGAGVSSRTGLDTNWLSLLLVQTNGVPNPGFVVHGAPMMSYWRSETRQLLVQPDGRILFAAAIFDSPTRTVGSTYLPDRAVIGRVLADGTWDNSFAMLTCDLSEATQIPGPFWFNNLALVQRQPLQPVPGATFSQQPDGILVMAGAFNAVDGEPRRRLARLEADGELRGVLRLALTQGPPDELTCPPEIETPYAVETSTDLIHWSSWVANDYPWWPIQLPLPTDWPARFFRARVANSPAP